MQTPEPHYDWAVIGAGPAGIAVVGKLIDNHAPPEKIVWIDPAFSVGDFGTKWRKVPSNTKVDRFLQFLAASSAFRFSECENDFALHNMDPNFTCALHIMGEPLQWVTEQLKNQVAWHTGYVTQLKLNQRRWEISLASTTLYAKNIVLAIGAEPKSLPLPGVDTISLDIALDRDCLSENCHSKDTVAVFGSSHSAILIIRNLLETCHIKKIINFYQSPLRYAVYLDDGILFDDTGLKGTTADWAREHIDGTLPEKLQRVLSTEENLQRYFSQCTKAIHAVGFKRRALHVEGLGELHYNNKNGIIAPGLFGFGIAFPEAKIDRFGNLEHRVGLWKFMEYLNNVLPVWVRYST